MANNIEANKLKIEQVLTSFNIGHGDISVTVGSAVTLYEFKAQIGVRMSKIRNLKDEFTAALDASFVRVIAPIPEKGTIGIEVPNTERKSIGIMEMLYSDEYMNTTMELPLVIGRKVDNSVFMADLANMPHLLVAGATGMGKSVGLNVIIASLLNKLTPDELKLVLIDPKQVELSIYDEIARPFLAHLKGYPSIITEAEDAKDTLNAVVRLMETRYTLLKNAGVRNIQDYNGLSGVESLPYYVVVIDEYGDLILSANDREIERTICRIAQKARAVGIHMIISTQRPDTKIVTGSIKANFPTRIAFRTTTGTDSRVVLDRIGAERLTGKGDMLYFDGSPEFVRCQCAFISTEEVSTMCHELSEEYADAEETILPELYAEEVQYVEPRILLSKEDLKKYVQYNLLRNDGTVRGTVQEVYSVPNALRQLQKMCIVAKFTNSMTGGFNIYDTNAEDINRKIEKYYADDGRRKFDRILPETIKFLKWCQDHGMWTHMCDKAFDKSTFVSWANDDFRMKEVMEQVLEAGIFTRNEYGKSVYWGVKVLRLPDALDKLYDFYGINS